MKKKILFLVVNIFLISNLFAFTIFDKYGLWFEDLYMELENDNTGNIVDYDGELFHNFTFKHEIKNNFEFITNINPPICIGPKRKIQINPSDEIIDNIMLLVGKEFRKNGDMPFAIGYTQKGFPIVSIFPMIMELSCKYKDCTSFLTEGDIKYTIDNLDRFLYPWVEGVPGNGEGEGFTIVGHDKYLLIVNGYISPEKPYLYERNSRVKELKITGSKSGKSKIVEVIDTPNPQTVDISFLEEGDDTIVRIHSVYSGTKYEDTCISMCRLYPNKVIPYLGEDE